MYKKEEIDDSIEFCKDIDKYYKAKKENSFLFMEKKEQFEGMAADFKNHPYYSNLSTEGNSLHLGDSQGALEDKSQKPSLLKGLLGMMCCLILAFLIATFITTYLGVHTKVSGISMEDTLSDGEHLIVDKISYRFHDPKRFDIIIFPYSSSVEYVKRIIGLPGEKVQIIEGDIFVNGVILKESYGKGSIKDAGLAEGEIILGEEEYFVLGDNRNHSRDSRFKEVGVIYRKDIVGRGWFRIYPLNKIGLLTHK